MTQEKATKSLDNKGRVTLFGVYAVAKKQIEEDLKKKPHLKKRTVSYRDFYVIISTYLTEVFGTLLVGLKYDLFNRFGSIRIVKTKLNRSRPQYFKPEGVNETFTRGYWHFVFWDAPKKWRMHNFVFSDFTQEGKKGFIYKIK
jgi:hypothetical protein